MLWHRLLETYPGVATIRCDFKSPVRGKRHTPATDAECITQIIMIFPGTQAILFQADNPKRGGSGAYARWALYRTATTVGEARRLGMTPQDLKEALRQGHAQLQ